MKTADQSRSAVFAPDGRIVTAPLQLFALLHNLPGQTALQFLEQFVVVLEFALSLPGIEKKRC